MPSGIATTKAQEKWSEAQVLDFVTVATCAVCNVLKGEGAFSKHQWRLGSVELSDASCADCVAQAEAEALRVHGGMSMVQKEAMRSHRSAAAEKEAVLVKARKAKAADAKWRADREAAAQEKAKQERWAEHDAERRKGNGRVYRTGPRFNTNLSGAHTAVAAGEERVTAAAEEEEAADEHLEQCTAERRAARKHTAGLRERLAERRAEAAAVAEERCGATTIDPARAFASHARGDFYGGTHLHARIATLAAAHAATVAWIEAVFVLLVQAADMFLVLLNK